MWRVTPDIRLYLCLVNESGKLLFTRSIFCFQLKCMSTRYFGILKLCKFAEVFLRVPINKLFNKFHDKHVAVCISTIFLFWIKFKTS